MKKKEKYWLSFLLLLPPFLLLAQEKTITISEINFHSDSTRNAGDWIELYNYGNDELNISGWIITRIEVNQFLTFPSNTIIAPKGYLVLYQDLNLFESQHQNINNKLGPLGWELSGKHDIIRLYDSQFQEVLHVEYFDILPWPKASDGHGRTMELQHYLSDLNDGNNWQAGCIGGSPGKEYTSCNEKLIISEINYKSSSSFDVGDWIELRNVGGVFLNISGWEIGDKKDSVRFKIPINTVLEAGKNLVIASKINKFKSKFPSVVNVIGSFKFGLGSDGEVIKIYDANGIVQSSLYYNSTAPWPSNAFGEGFTLELSDSSKNLNAGSSWFTGCFGGSPGSYYSLPCILSIENMSYQIEKKIFPNPANSSVHIEIETIDVKSNNINLILFDPVGRMIHEGVKANFKEDNKVTFSLNTNALKEGMYFYQVVDGLNLLTSGKFIVLH
jgi:hypothetical protein